MSLNTVIKEFIRMIKEKIIFVILAIVIMACAMTAFGMMKNKKGTEVKKVSKNDALDYLEKVYENNPATFKVLYIYTKDGTYFMNSTFLDEYFSSDNFLDEFSRKHPELEKDLKTWAENERNMHIAEKYEGRGGIFFHRDKVSNIITAYINCLKTSEDNLVLAKEIFHILNEGLPLTANTTMTVMKEPSIEPEHIYPIVPESGKDAEELDPNSPINLPSEAKISKIKTRPLKTWTFIGALGGTFMSIGLILFYYLFRNRIRYAFQYSWDVNDLQFIFNMKNEEDKKEFLKLTQAQDGHIVLANPGLDSVKSIDDLIGLENEEGIEKISIVVEEDKTLRSWYRKQKYIADRIKAPVYILQIIGLKKTGKK